MNYKLNEQSKLKNIQNINSNSFNDIQLSTNNNSFNLNQGLSFSYVSGSTKKNQNLEISTINSDNNKYSNNNCHQGISFISNKNTNKSNNFQISKTISQKEISYYAPEKDNIINNQNSISSQNMSYIVQKKEKELSNKNKSNNNNQSFQFQSSSQSDTYSYIAPKKKQIITPSFNNSIEYIYPSKDNNIKAFPNKIGFSGDIKFNHNESMTFICHDNKLNNNFIKCSEDNFKYIKDKATGAQILE